MDTPKPGLSRLARPSLVAGQAPSISVIWRPADVARGRALQRAGGHLALVAPKTALARALARRLAAPAPYPPGRAFAGMMLTWEPVSGFEPLTCRLQDGCSAN